MKVCIIQPPYSVDFSETDKYFEKEMELIGQCDESMDIIVPPDAITPYPRVCAHRGFNTVAPENSLPAFGAAVASSMRE
ncbi:MAG: hypothetical protein IKY33_01245 [Clostridia bacterium]|nr:hypothetical protein [Clostridia bacterium]